MMMGDDESAPFLLPTPPPDPSPQRNSQGVEKELKRSRKGVGNGPPSPSGDVLVMLWDALGTLWERFGDALGTLLGALAHSGML